MFEKRYELLSPLGSGGMGVVHRALDRLTGEYVALKQVKVSETVLETYITETRSATEEARLGLALEFRTLSSLRHPHIISVLDYGFTDEKAPQCAGLHITQPHICRKRPAYPAHLAYNALSAL